jgi:hypothetical protein
MLGARPASRDRQRHAHADKAARRPGKSVACRSDRGADRENSAAAPHSRQPAGRELKARHGANIDRAESRQRREAQSEFGLPHGQHHVDQIGVSVVQGMGDAGHEQRPFAEIGGLRRQVACGDGHRTLDFALLLGEILPLNGEARLPGHA